MVVSTVRAGGLSCTALSLDFRCRLKSKDNAFIEDFNGRFRQECLNENWFLSLNDAEKKVESWRRLYDRERPLSALGNLPSREVVGFARESCTQTSVEDGARAPHCLSPPTNLPVVIALDSYQTLPFTSIRFPAEGCLGLSAGSLRKISHRTPNRSKTLLIRADRPMNCHWPIQGKLRVHPSTSSCISYRNRH